MVCENRPFGTTKARCGSSSDRCIVEDGRARGRNCQDEDEHGKMWDCAAVIVIVRRGDAVGTTTNRSLWGKDVDDHDCFRYVFTKGGREDPLFSEAERSYDYEYDERR